MDDGGMDPWTPTKWIGKWKELKAGPTSFQCRKFLTLQAGLWNQNITNGFVPGLFLKAREMVTALKNQKIEGFVRIQKHWRNDWASKPLQPLATDRSGLRIERTVGNLRISSLNSLYGFLYFSLNSWKFCRLFPPTPSNPGRIGLACIFW